MVSFDGVVLKIWMPQYCVLTAVIIFLATISGKVVPKEDGKLPISVVDYSRASVDFIPAVLEDRVVLCQINKRSEKGPLLRRSFACGSAQDSHVVFCNIS